MKTTVNERARPVVIARSEVKRRPDRPLPDHGFFNGRNAALPEVPLRNWGRVGAPSRRTAVAQSNPE
jgi:hypothetical protein